MKNYCIILFALFISCVHRTKQVNIDLVMKDASSYEYDFVRRIYTVHYSDKPALEINFQLTTDEKNKITQKYYQLSLDELPERITLEADCNISPVFFTVLEIKRSESIQKIEIETGCDNYSLLQKGKAKRVNQFIDFVKNMVKNKPEIRNVPKSTVRYM